ncbi:hypothetical protein Tco_0654974 [Tanacetum coccineum]|uniref:Uncharacterized protein n=1 Tax=Tanacetum coccineum TaxID=301880 RepID=A0ABQ4X5N5_9ASTR
MRSSKVNFYTTLFSRLCSSSWVEDSFVSKVKEFVRSTATDAPKRLIFKGKKSRALKKPILKKSQLTILPPKSVIGESTAESSQEAADDAGSQQLVSKATSKASASQSSASTRSGPLISSPLGPRSEPIAQHISEIVFDPVQDSADTPREDRFYASIIVDPSVANDIYHPDWELTNDFIMDKGLWAATLLTILPHQDLERRLGRRNAALEKMEAELERRNKIVVLRNASLRRQVDGEVEVRAEFARMLDEQQQRFDDQVAALDARLGRMAKEMDEEFAPMLRDANATKDFLVRRGFHYFLNKFEESDILGARFGAWISATIADGMRRGLEARFFHGNRGTDTNSIPVYNPYAAKVYANTLKALSDVPFPFLDQMEACFDQPFSYLEALLVMGVHEDKGNEVRTLSHPASGSTPSAGGVIDQSLVALSVPYAGDAGTAAQDTAPTNLVGTVETETVHVETALDGNAFETLASAPNASGAPSTDLTFNNQSLFD